MENKETSELCQRTSSTFNLLYVIYAGKYTLCMGKLRSFGKPFIFILSTVQTSLSTQKYKSKHSRKLWNGRSSFAGGDTTYMSTFSA